MRILVLLSILIFSQISLAQNLVLECSVTENFEEVLMASIKLQPKQRHLKFGEHKQFRFFLSDNSNDGESKTELQIYDSSTPSRSYAVTDFSKSNSLELSLWTQEYLLSVICKK